MLWCHLEAYRLQIHICIHSLISRRPTMRCTQLLALVALNQKKDCQDPGSACVCFVLQNAVFLNVTTSSGCVCVWWVLLRWKHRNRKWGFVIFTQHPRRNPQKPWLPLTLTRSCYHRFITSDATSTAPHFKGNVSYIWSHKLASATSYFTK